jgi:uncharacterized SAM-binding protein YcdF (DUF218 family)
VRKGTVGVVVGGVVLAAWGEWANWRASRSELGSDANPGPEAVVVLGFRNRHPNRINALNRWRVRAALRSIDGSDATLVFCGGENPRGGAPEGPLMARYAENRGHSANVIVEDRSRTTWENIENAIPLIKDASRIKVVSNPLHAQKGRMYMRHQCPEVASRLVRGADYRFGEWIIFKPAFAIHGLRDLSRSRRNLESLHDGL